MASGFPARYIFGHRTHQGQIRAHAFELGVPGVAFRLHRDDPALLEFAVLQASFRLGVPMSSTD